MHRVQIRDAVDLAYVCRGWGIEEARCEQRHLDDPVLICSDVPIGQLDEFRDPVPSLLEFHERPGLLVPTGFDLDGDHFLPVGDDEIDLQPPVRGGEVPRLVSGTHQSTADRVLCELTYVRPAPAGHYDRSVRTQSGRQDTGVIHIGLEQGRVRVEAQRHPRLPHSIAERYEARIAQPLYRRAVLPSPFPGLHLYVGVLEALALSCELGGNGLEAFPEQQGVQPSGVLHDVLVEQGADLPQVLLYDGVLLSGHVVLHGSRHSAHDGIPCEQFSRLLIGEVVYRTAMPDAFADILGDPVADAQGPHELLEVHAVHLLDAGVSQRRQTAVLVLLVGLLALEGKSEEGTGGDDPDIAALCKGFEAGYRIGDLLDLIYEQQGVTGYDPDSGKEAEPVDDRISGQVSCEEASVVLAVLQIELDVGSESLSEFADRIGLPYLAGTDDDHGPMVVGVLPFLQDPRDLALHTIGMESGMKCFTIF